MLRTLCYAILHYAILYYTMYAVIEWNRTYLYTHIYIFIHIYITYTLQPPPFGIYFFFVFVCVYGYRESHNLGCKECCALTCQEARCHKLQMRLLHHGCASICRPSARECYVSCTPGKVADIDETLMHVA